MLEINGAGPPRRPQDLPAAFAECFNSGDPRAVRELYEADAAFVPRSGTTVYGDEAIAAENAPFLALGRPISVRPRHVHVTGDIALLVVDWEISRDGAAGGDGAVQGTATDVARRGADGCWRYLIDSPFGGTREPSS